MVSRPETLRQSNLLRDMVDDGQPRFSGHHSYLLEGETGREAVTSLGTHFYLLDGETGREAVT